MTTEIILERPGRIEVLPEDQSLSNQVNFHILDKISSLGRIREHSECSFLSDGVLDSYCSSTLWGLQSLQTLLRDGKTLV
jgi:hypothetical protein